MKYRLDDLFELQMGKTPARKNSDYWNSKDNKWIAISDLNDCGKYISDTKEYISDKAVEESGIKIIPANTVIMSFKLSIGKTAITKDEMYSNEAIMCFIDKKTTEISPDYLYYLLLGYDWEKGTNKAVMGKTLNKSTLSQMIINVHSSEEQKKIVNILDNINRIINYYKEYLIKLDLLVKSRFVEIFSNDNFTGCKLSDECQIITKGTTPTTIGYSFEKYGVNFVKIENISSDGLIITDGIMFISEECHESMKRSQLKDGDILFSIAGAIGKTALVTPKILPANINQALAIVRLKEDAQLRREFLMAVLQSGYIEEQYSALKRGVAQLNLSLKDVGDFMIPNPPIEMQKEYVAFVEQIDKLKFGNYQ